MAKRGRPPLPKALRKSTVVSVRMLPAEHARIRRAAKAAGMPIADYVMRPHRES